MPLLMHSLHQLSLHQQVMMPETFLERVAWPGDMPSFVGGCRNLPFNGKAMRDSRGRVSRKEYPRSRHQRLFEENVRKTGKDVIYEP